MNAAYKKYNIKNNLIYAHHKQQQIWLINICHWLGDSNETKNSKQKQQNTFFVHLDTFHLWNHFLPNLSNALLPATLHLSSMHRWSGCRSGPLNGNN